MKQKLVWLFIIAIILYMMTGCGMGRVISPDNDQGEIEEGAQDIPENIEKPSFPIAGGNLSIPIPEPNTSNPLLAQSKELMSFFGLIYEGMFSYDETLKPVPALVESWDTLEDGAKWEFHLKKGIRWHHGKELTGEDVKFTFEMLRNSLDGVNSYYANSLFESADIAAIEVSESNPYTVVVMLNEPLGNLCSLMTFPILPKDIYQAPDSGVAQQQEINLHSLVGTGPYKVDIQNSDGERQIRLVRNREWWGREPYIDVILAKIYRDNEEARIAFQKREVDLVDTHVIFAETYAVEEDANLYRYLTQSYEFIGFNFKKSTLLQDRRIREAIAYGLDRKDIISRVYFNNSHAVDVPIPSDSWLYDPNSRIYDYQPSKARQILMDAGWKDSDEDGVFEKIEGDTRTELAFSIVTNADNNVRKDVAKLVKEQMSHIGIKVNLEFLPWEELNKALEEGNFDMVLAGYYLDLSADLHFAFHSSEIGKGLHNFIGYHNPELDQMLDKSRTAASQREIEAAYKDIQAHLVRELPFISLYFRGGSLITRDRVKGVRAPREMQIFQDIEEWYLQD